MGLPSDICRASRNEQEGRQAGVGISTVIARVRSTEQSAYINKSEPQAKLALSARSFPTLSESKQSVG